MKRSRSSPMFSSPETFDMDSFPFPSPPDREMAPPPVPYQVGGLGPIVRPRPRRPSAASQFVDPGSSRSSTTLMGRDSTTPTPMSSHYSTLHPTPRPSMSSRPLSSLFLTFPLPPNSDIRGSFDGVHVPNRTNDRRSPEDGVHGLTIKVATPLAFVPPAAPPPDKPLPCLPPSSPASSVIRKKSSRSLAPPSAMKHGTNGKPKGTGIGLRIRVDSLGKRFKRDDRILMAPPREDWDASIPKVPVLKRESWNELSGFEGNGFSETRRRPRGIILETPPVPKLAVDYNSSLQSGVRPDFGLNVPSFQVGLFCNSFPRL